MPWVSFVPSKSSFLKAKAKAKAEKKQQEFEPEPNKKPTENMP